MECILQSGLDSLILRKTETGDKGQRRIFLLNLNKQKGKEWGSWVIFILPALLVVLLLQLYPLLYSLFLAFQDWKLTESASSKGFIGLWNFINVFRNEVFRRSVLNSLIITGSAVSIELVLGVALAYLTHREKVSNNLIRTTILLPMVIAPVAAGTLWRMMLNGRAGLINHLLSFLNIQGPNWLADPGLSMFSVIMLEIWQFTPFVMIISAAAITSIPTALREAAAIDGAGRFMTFKHVDIPLLAPTLALTMIFRILESLLTLDSIYSLTFGGPGYSTYTLTFYIYNEGLRSFNFGQAAAASWLFMIFTSLCIAWVFRFQNKDK